MKKSIISRYKSLAVAAAFLLTSSMTCYSAEFVSVVKDGVNVRTGPGTDSPVYMELFQGYPLQIVERKGEWLKVQDFEKDSGWIYSNLVEKATTVIVIAENTANMRSGPGTQNAIVANIERGVVLELVERNDKWVKVKHISGTQGWIYAPLVWP